MLGILKKIMIWFQSEAELFKTSVNIKKMRQIGEDTRIARATYQQLVNKIEEKHKQIDLALQEKLEERIRNEWNKVSLTELGSINGVGQRTLERIRQICESDRLFNITDSHLSIFQSQKGISYEKYSNIKDFIGRKRTEIDTQVRGHFSRFDEILNEKSLISIFEESEQLKQDSQKTKDQIDATERWLKENNYTIPRSLPHWLYLRAFKKDSVRYATNFSLNIKIPSETILPSNAERTDLEKRIVIERKLKEKYGTSYVALGSGLTVGTGTTFSEIDINKEIENVETKKIEEQVPLRPYQVIGLKFMIKYKQVILGDEMGLGKTIQALSYCSYIQKDNAKARFLVISPLSVVENWKRETDRF